MDALSELALEGMDFYAHHGCFTEERVIGTHFSVNLYIEFDSRKAELSDQLQDTIDYPAVYRRVKEQMNIPSKLLEHVARRIVDDLMQSFPAIVSIRIKISKLNPPLGERIGQVSFSMQRKRQ